MTQLTFNEADHTYTVDGEDFPSVSEICRFVSKELYKDVDQFHLDRAAERGTKVHKACEVLDKYRTVEADEDIVPFIRAFVSFTKEHSPVWQLIEYPSANMEDKYAGTIDRYGVMDEKRILLDIKTTANIDPAHRVLYGIQLNLYRRMLHYTDLGVDEMYILQLKKDGSYKLYPIAMDDELPNAVLALHNALRKKRRKKAND